MTWDAMLRFTRVELELLLDYDMVLMFERGIRGGICQVSHRYAVANNSYMPNINDKEESSFITYLDASNLYGHAMRRPLPQGKSRFPRYLPPERGIQNRIYFRSGCIPLNFTISTMIFRFWQNP
jgi:hypothetical protein